MTDAARTRSATERMRPTLPVAPKPPMDAEQERLKQERLEKIRFVDEAVRLRKLTRRKKRQQQREKKEAMLRAGENGAAGAGAAPPSSPLPSRTSGEDEVLDTPTAVSPRGRSVTSSVAIKRQTSTGTGIVRAAGRGKTTVGRATGSRSPRLSVDVGEAGPGQRSSLSKEDVLSGPPTPTSPPVAKPTLANGTRPPAPTGLRLSGASTPEMSHRAHPAPIEVAEDILVDEPPPSPSLAHPPRPPSTPPPAAPASSGATSSAGGWGFLGNVLTSVIWSGERSPRSTQQNQQQPPPPQQQQSSSSSWLASAVSLPSAAAPAAATPPPPPPSHAPATSSPSFTKKRDSLTTLEDLLELQESVDALRLMVAQQGSQLREQQHVIESLSKKVAALEMQVNPDSSAFE
jgi:hypothetical protein